MLDLSPVTLLFVETRAHDITKRVISDCLSKASFGDVLIYTDKPDEFAGLGRVIPCADFPNKREAGKFYYSEAMLGVTTDFALMLEWDAGIFDPTKWKPEFFNYDYIGAPWPTHITRDSRNAVGNGGFTLMSRALGRYVADNRRQHPVYTDMDVCRSQYPHYTEAGFKWPDAGLASHFAWELGPRNPEHFGFHGAFTWPSVLSRDEIVIRAKIMLKSDYLSEKIGQLFTAAPWVLDELTPEETGRYVRPPALNLRIPGVMTSQQRQALALLQARRRTATVLKVPLSNQGLKA